MTHAKLKLTVAALVLLAGLGYLATAGVRSGWVYYVEVDEFLADESFHDRRVRVCGTASPEGFVNEPGRMHAAFTVTGQTGRIPVVYSGVVPSNLQPGSEVVVEGRLDSGGVFRADVMLTKCASKYEAEDHAKRLRGES